MPKITIRECQKASQTNDGSFAATVSVDDRTQYEVTVRDPFEGSAGEGDLEFYFEKWISFPFDGRVRAQRASESITPYGEALFEQVFRQNPDVYVGYREA